MSISEAVSLVIEAGEIDNKGKIYVLDMGRPIKILNLAKKMCNFFGYKLVEQKKTNFKNQILLKIIGLGNGEKIKEKLLEKNERFEKSSHPLIFRVENKSNRKVKIIDVCSKILEECKKNNISNLQKILKKSPFYYKNKIKKI
jgi:FlaA1/EpsC-like NDP-sugar epimerase